MTMFSALLRLWDSSAFFPLHRLRFTRKARLGFYRSIIQLQKTDVPLYQALRTLHDSYSNNGKNPYDVTAMVLSDAIRSLAGGSKTLTAAIRPWLPDDEAAQLAAGEEAGRLVQTLQSIIRLIKVKSGMAEALLKKMMEPFLLTVLAIGNAFTFAQKIIPTVTRTQDPTMMHGAARFSYLLSVMVTDYTVLLFTIPALLIGLIIWSLPRRGWGGFRLFLEHFPPWSIYKELHGATFLINVAVMLESGIPLFRGLELLRAQANPWMRERIELTMFGLRQGKNFGQALANTECDFPARKALPFLIVLSSQKGFEQTISIYADEWLDESMKRVETSLELVRTVIMVGFAVLAALLFFGLAQMGGLPTSF